MYIEEQKPNSNQKDNAWNEGDCGYELFTYRAYVLHQNHNHPQTTRHRCWKSVIIICLSWHPGIQVKCGLPQPVIQAFMPIISDNMVLFNLASMKKKKNNKLQQSIEAARGWIDGT